MTHTEDVRVDCAKAWLEAHGIGPTDLCDYMGEGNRAARYMRAVRFYNGDSKRTDERITAALRCATDKLGRRVTYEEVFLGGGIKPEWLP